MGIKQVQELEPVRNIDLREELIDRRQGVIIGISSLPYIPAFHQAAGDARVRVASIISLYGGSEASVPENKRGELQNWKDKFEKAKDAVNDLEKKQNELNREKEAVEDKISRIPHYCSLKDLRRYQDLLNEAEQNISALKDAIERQRDIITDAEKRVPILSELSKKREDILSDIAVGRASNEDLKKIDHEYSKKKKEFDGEKEKANETILEAQQTIAGLTRKLSQAESEFSKIKGYKSDLICDFLMGQAEDLYEGYLQLALSISDNYQQFVAINTLIDKYAPSSFNTRILKNKWRNFSIPSLNLQICEEIEGDNLFETGKMDHAKAVEEELKRVHALGVDLI